MKRKVIASLVACAVIGGAGAVYGEKVPLTQLPERVQQAIKQQSQGETLQHVERETRDGQTVYQAEFKREGVNRRITFLADGTLLPDQGVTARATGAFERQPSIALSELPPAVQKAVKEQQAGREIADVDKEMWNGKAVYEIEFKEKGPNSRIHIASDGSLVVDKEKRGRHLGTQLSETPAAVQATVKRVVSTAEIEDVDRESRDGQVVYDVEVKQEGLNRHLKIAENGTLLSDSNTREGRGIGERVRERVGYDRDASTLTLDQVPAAVQKTIREQGNLGTLKPIKRETRNGRVQYDLEWEKDGRNLRLTIGEDGTILKDNR